MSWSLLAEIGGRGLHLSRLFADERAMYLALDRQDNSEVLQKELEPRKVGKALGHEL